MSSIHGNNKALQGTDKMLSGIALKYKKIFDSNMDAVICMDTGGRIFSWNTQAEKIFGWEASAIIGKTVAETIVPSEYREKHIDGIRQYLAGNQGSFLNKLVEVSAINRAGQLLPVELTIIPLLENDIRFFCAFIRDISERKNAQAKEKKIAGRQKILANLSEKTNRAQTPEEIYELTLDALQESIGADKASILLFDNNNYMRFVACRNLSARYKQAAEGHSPWTADEKDARPIFVPDASKDPALQKLLPVISDEGICALGFIPLIHQQQLLGKFMVYFTAPHQFEDDEIQVIQSVAVNVAFAIWEKRSAVALKESETKFRAFFENSMDGILLITPDGCVLGANPAACAMFGMTEQEVILTGRSGLVVNDNRLSSVLNQRNETGKATGELTLIRGDGSKFPAEISSSVFSDAAGNKKVSIIIRDITERKKNEEALVNSKLYLRGTLDSTNDGILAIDKNGNVITTNNRFAELWRIPGNLIEQKDDQALLEYVLDQLAEPDAFLSKVKELYQSDCTSFDILQFKDDRVFERYSTPLILNQDIVGRVWSFRDVTAREKAGQALRESEEKYRSLVEHASDGIVITDINGVCAEANSTVCNMTGYAKEEFGKKSLFELVIINEGDVPLRIAEVLAGKSVLQERKVRKKNGDILFVELNSKLLPDNRILIIVRDISERKKTEAQIKRQKEQYDELVKNIPVGVYKFRMTPDGRMSFDYISPRLCEMISVKEEDAYRDVMNAFRVVHHSDFGQFMASIKESFITKQKFLWEGRGIINGELKWMKIESTPKVLENGDTLWDGVIADTTERKIAEETLLSSEERYRDLVDNITELICTHDLEGRILSVNHAAEKLMGYKLDLQKNLNIRDILAPGSKEKFHEYIERIKTTGHAEGLMRVKTYSGEIRIWEYNNSLKTAGVNTPVVRGYARDITERKKAQDALRESEDTFRRLFNESADPVLLLDDTGFTDCNQSAVSVFGYSSKQEILSKKPWDISPERQPDGRLSTEKAAAMIEKAAKHGYNRFEWVHTKSDGAEFPVEVMITPILIKGKQSFYALLRDITERKKAEERIRINEARLTKAQQIGKLGYWQQDLNSNMIWGSEEARKIYGFQPVAGEIAGEIVAACIPDSAKLRQAAIDLLKYNKKFDLEFLINPADGSPPKYISAIAELERNDQGMPVRFMGVLRDITEYKKAEELLLKEKEFSDSVINNLPEVFVMFDEKGKFLRWNKNFETISGYDSDEISVMLPGDFVDDDEKYLAAEKMREGFETGETAAEINFFTKHKEKIPYHFNGWRVLIKDHPCLIAIGFDLTERKKAEQLIRTSEQKYRTVVEQAIDAIALYDLSGKVLDVNTGSSILLGYSKEELMKMYLSEILSEDDLKNNPVQFDLLQKGESTIKQRVMRRKDGSVVHTEVRSQQLPDGRFLSVVRDLTERIKAQEQIELEKELSDSIINSLPGIFYLYDGQGTFLRWNKNFEFITGYSAEEIKKMHPLDFYDEGEKERIAQRIKDVFRGKRPGVEVVLFTKSGNKVPLFISSLAISYEGKSCLMGIGIDISERKKAEKELEDSYKAIRKLSEHLQNIREDERSHMAREIHDELGQQLTVMKMDISWINKKIAAEGGELIKEKTKELMTMLDQTVKTVRRISSELRPSLLDDLGLIAAMEWQLNEFEKRSGIKTSLDIPPADIKLPDAIRTSLFRIFQESLTNVARHSHAKKVKVAFSQKEGSLVLAITDDGRGFDKQKIADKKTLGILGMQERTSMIGGTYEILSKPGKGTSVVVTIPLSRQ